MLAGSGFLCQSNRYPEKFSWNNNTYMYVMRMRVIHRQLHTWLSGERSRASKGFVSTTTLPAGGLDLPLNNLATTLIVITIILSHSLINSFTEDKIQDKRNEFPIGLVKIRFLLFDVLTINGHRTVQTSMIQRESLIKSKTMIKIVFLSVNFVNQQF